MSGISNPSPFPLMHSPDFEVDRAELELISLLRWSSYFETDRNSTPSIFVLEFLEIIATLYVQIINYCKLTGRQKIMQLSRLHEIVFRCIIRTKLWRPVEPVQFSFSLEEFFQVGNVLIFCIWKWKSVDSGNVRNDHLFIIQLPIEPTGPRPNQSTNITVKLHFRPVAT